MIRSKGLRGAGVGALILGVGLSGPAALGQVPKELDAYVRRSEPKFSAKVTSKTANRLEVALTSQTWQGFDWKHSLVVLEPKSLKSRGFAILAITGGKQNAKDLDWAQQVADRSGMPVASLFDIPNQPLWDLREDDLVAYSFAQYLKTSQSDWPLLFPMAKSAIKAMDALQIATKATRNPLKKFIVCGESKRGWTTWLAAATGDRRIAGISPMIYDNLNIPEQLEHQMKIWGHYSPMYAAYKERGLLELLETPPGKRLAAMVDPYSYVKRMKAPLLAVIGGNDPFWAVDATSVYWNQLPMRKALLVMPNAGHEFGDMKLMSGGLSAFAASCAGRFSFPAPSWQGGAMGQVIIKSPGAKPLWGKLWRAQSPTKDFTSAKWEPVKKLVGGKMLVESFLSLMPQNSAWTAELHYSLGGMEFSLFTPPLVLPSR